MHKITCSKCGEEGEVPFKPREGSEVLCKKCFMESKGIKPKDEEGKEEKVEEAADEEPIEEGESVEEESEETEEESEE
jgi:CxxC-x17-CxxC domain-containing protein